MLFEVSMVFVTRCALDDANAQLFSREPFEVFGRQMIRQADVAGADSLHREMLLNGELHAVDAD